MEIAICWALLHFLARLAGRRCVPSTLCHMRMRWIAMLSFGSRTSGGGLCRHLALLATTIGGRDEVIAHGLRLDRCSVAF